MLTAILLCFVQCFLGIYCDFVSITVAEDVALSEQNIGATVDAHCRTQRSKFGHNLVVPCNLYRWFYEPRTFELTCVCEAHGERFENGTLLQKIDNSSGILSIDRVRFAAGADVKQRCFVYELKIWTLSDPVQTALGLFSGAATKAVAVLNASCSPIQNESSAYYCVTGHCNNGLVTWEYPENWSGPVRYLKNIAYTASETTVHVLGMYWPEELHVDTVLPVQAKGTKICKRFFKSSIMKCRVEFLEETFVYKPAKLARLNLLMSSEFGEGLTAEERPLHLARRLRPFGQVCPFPVNIREKTASYVPSNTIVNGENFEFRVTFRKSTIMRWRTSKPKAKVICNKLIKISKSMIENCTDVTTYGDYGFSDVLFLPTTTSLWEAQIRLMTQLNLKNKRRCNFNVAVKPVPKGY